MTWTEEKIGHGVLEVLKTACIIEFLIFFIGGSIAISVNIVTMLGVTGALGGILATFFMIPACVGWILISGLIAIE